MLTASWAPGSVGTRWLTEDVPYGLVTWADLGRRTGVATPVIDAVITLASAVLGVDYRAGGRTAEDLGLTGFAPDALTAFLELGSA